MSPNTQTATAGGAGIAFTATLTGATGTISWTLSPASGAGTISPATGTTTTYTPPADGVASSTTVTLRATAGSLTDSATITLNPPASITVNGTVVGLSGVPVPGSSVVIGAQSAITGSDGTFTIHDVSVPYDLVSVVSAPSKLGVVYKGLTRTHPIIVHLGLSPALPYSGTVAGNLAPMPAAATFVAWGSPEVRKTSTNIAVNPYSLTLAWLGDSSTTGTLHALQWHPATGAPAGYDGYGSKTDVTVTDSVITSGQNILLSAVTAGNLTGTITVPASYTISGRAMGVTFDDGASIALASEASSATSFSYVTPASVGGKIAVAALATGADGVIAQYIGGLDPNDTGVSLAPRAAPVLGLPIDGGAGITTSTTFTWTAFAGGLHVVVFAPVVASDPAYWVLTTGTSTTIPDLSGQGLGLPGGGAAYHWSILAAAPWSSVDALATGHSIVPDVDAYYESIGAAHSFTTQ